MKSLATYIRSLTHYFRFFKAYLGNKIYAVIAISSLVALLDGIGLALFLPLLQFADTGSRPGDTYQVGGRAAEYVEWTGLSANLPMILLAILLFFTLKGMTKFTAEFFRTKLHFTFANRLRLELLSGLTDFGYESFTHTDSGRIQNIMSAEVLRIIQAFRSYSTVLQCLIMTTVYVALAYLSDARFAVVVTVGGFISSIVFNQIYRRTKRLSGKVSSEMNTFQGFLVESVRAFKFLKATGLIRTYHTRLATSIQHTEHLQRKIGVLGGVATSMREPLMITVVVAAIFIQLYFFSGVISTIILSLLLFYRGLGTLGTMQVSYNHFLGVSGAIDNLRSFSGEMIAGKEPSGTLPFVGLNDRIVVHRLSYSYGAEPVLRNISFSLQRFESIGIVGESGVGKTTLVNLMCGLLKSPLGTISIDGKEIGSLNKTDYRSRIGYVTQEAPVFSDTILNNITSWNSPERKSDDRVREVINLAHAGFIHQLPEGINTRIGINGVNLSGGQLQRIAIARELYREVDILFLDEATSSLDSRSEMQIQRQIEALAGNITLVVIAHRLSTLRSVDKILHLKVDGSFELGTYETLYAESSTFRRLADLQTL